MTPPVVIRANTIVTVAPPLPHPAELDAVVEEQDTALLLRADPVLIEPQADIGRLVRDMVEQQPHTPGDIIVHRGRPLIFQAIVHDLDRDPSCRGAWINAALENLIREFNRRQIGTVAMPLLGSVHGRFDQAEFMALLTAALRLHPPQRPRRLWLTHGGSTLSAR